MPFVFFFFTTFVSRLLRVEGLVFLDKWIINDAVQCWGAAWLSPGAGGDPVPAVLGFHRSDWKLAPKRDLVERGWGCWVCAAGGTSQGWVGTPGTVFCSVFQHRRWNSNLLSDILVKQMESTLPVNLQGKGLWEQPLHMSFPPWFFLHA